MEYLNIAIPDGCCNKLWSKALALGALSSVAVWKCPRCLVEWKPTMREMGDGLDLIPVRLWEPVCPVITFHV